jgi:tetratricopeptide (TPR) repeat protein
MQTPKRTRAQILTNIGVIYDKVGEYETAYEYYMKSLEVAPKELKPRYNAAVALIGMNRLEAASDLVDDLILRKPGDKNSNNLKGSILLKMNRPEEAILYLKKSLSSSPSYYQALINIGVALYQTGEYDRSREVLESAHAQQPGQGLPLFCLIENRLRANDADSAEAYLQKLFNSATLDEINMVLESIGKNPFLVPMSYDILAPFIEKNSRTLNGM